MRYVIEAKLTSVDGTIERWIVRDQYESTRVFETIGYAREVARKYRAWTKDWAGKRSFRVVAEAGR